MDYPIYEADSAPLCIHVPSIRLLVKTLDILADRQGDAELFSLQNIFYGYVYYAIITLIPIQLPYFFDYSIEKY
jgi:hypothetical protein